MWTPPSTTSSGILKMTTLLHGLVTEFGSRAKTGADFQLGVLHACMSNIISDILVLGTCITGINKSKMEMGEIVRAIMALEYVMGENFVERD